MILSKCDKDFVKVTPNDQRAYKTKKNTLNIIIYNNIGLDI